ncbi:pectinesterase QRT1 [Carex littledalei]|uniref:Pectinesterase n=1 Tax=Carex littledalei TaxID=544730 RepID=A0A833QFU0_9POAL|nr:pectinesterase QRT1 [Carex littledalei]
MAIFQFLAVLLTILATIQTSSSFENESREFITWNDLTISNSNYTSKAVNQAQRGSRMIVVSQDGHGDSNTVQGAIDMVSDGNSERIKILIYPGIYRQVPLVLFCFELEKVIIPITKPYISLIGTGQGDTKITWNSKASDFDSTGNPIGTINSATFAVEADYFCAKEVVFENSAPAAVPGAKGEQAVALRLSGDKAMLYRSKILGTQDTLFDNQGRHYFFRCFIQGSIDFIFGNAKSLYQECTLSVVATSFGAVAASQRDSPTEDTGFSFVKSRIIGSGLNYLGRAWGRYSRVVYAYCRIDGIVRPDGWYDWDDVSRRSTAYFGEYSCSGAGAELGSKVSWAKSLTYQEAQPFMSQGYIDGNEWLML